VGAMDAAVRAENAIWECSVRLRGSAWTRAADALQVRSARWTSVFRSVHRNAGAPCVVPMGAEAPVGSVNLLRPVSPGGRVHASPPVRESSVVTMDAGAPVGNVSRISSAQSVGSARVTRSARERAVGTMDVVGPVESVISWRSA